MAAPQDQTEYTALKGGLDLESSSLTVKPGRALDLHNFEPVPGGGYRRMRGYEKYFGYPGPAETVLYSMTVNTVSNIGDPSASVISLTGATSGAAGYLVAKSGTTLYFIYAANDATPPFSNGENLTVFAPTVTITSAPVASTDGTRYAAMRAWMRAVLYPDFVAGGSVLAPAGSGSILGLCPSPTGLSTLAFRNTAAGTGVEIWKAADGDLEWTNLSTTWGLGAPDILWFDGGTNVETILLSAVFSPGVTITGNTSGATIALHWAPIIHSGDDSTMNTTGYLVGTVTGTFQNNEQLKIGATVIAIANGADSAYSIAPSGSYKFVRHNFHGKSNYDFIYGCDGVNPAFVLHNLVNGFIPILHPQTAIAGQPESNKPIYIEAHKNHLFLAFPGGSLQHSVLGDPVTFNGFLGAAEFAIGGEITGIKSTTGGGLAVYTRRKTFLLEGTSSANWTLRTISERAGAIDNTVQTLGQTYMMDDFGLTTLQRVQSFGDFDPVPLSRQIQTAIQEKLVAPASAMAGVSNIISTVAVRSSNQYRVYFDDGSGILFYVNELGQTEAATFKLGFVPTIVAVNNYADGSERVVAGDSSGNVYRLDHGYSFEGSNIYAVARLPYNHLKSPRVRKSYRQVELEVALAQVTDSEDVTIGVYTEVDFGSIDNPVVNLTAADIGQGMLWEIVDGSSTYWTTAQEKATSVPLAGTGNNISLILVSNQNDAAPFTLQGMVLRYRLRRQDRS